jgi:hypothetical protein
MHQDGQKQSMIDVAGVEQRCPSRYSRSHGGVESQAPGTRIDVAVRLALMDRFEPIRVGGEGFADGVVVLGDGGDRRELGRAAVVEGVGVNGEQRTDPIEGLIDTGPVTIAAM